MNNIRVYFHTNIDFYGDKNFPDYLPARPMVGDKVPFAGQVRHFIQYPILEIVSVELSLVDGTNEVSRYDCYLYFSDFDRECNMDKIVKILEHQRI